MFMLDQERFYDQERLWLWLESQLSRYLEGKSDLVSIADGLPWIEIENREGIGYWIGIWGLNMVGGQKELIGQIKSQKKG